MVGIIGIVCQEASRYSRFWRDVLRLKRPDGVEIVPSMDGSLAQSRNEIVRAMLETDAQWLIMIDDDHAFRADYLTKLLARPTVPILGSTYLTRVPPFHPTLYGPRMADGSFEVLTLDRFPTTGVHPVYACGASGLLVQRSVYESLLEPWYAFSESDHIGEDLYFCQKAQQAGIPVHVDVEARLAHLVPMGVEPHVAEGRWVTGLTRGELRISIPAAQRPPVKE